MKLQLTGKEMKFVESRPARALWIEIPVLRKHRRKILSRPARALWIEIYVLGAATPVLKSRPARALWIEIFFLVCFLRCLPVEAREGLVD